MGTSKTKASTNANERVQETINEEEVDVKGSGHLRCIVQVSGRARRFSTTAAAELSPGSAIRVSIGCGSRKRGKLGKVARALAYVDPITGRLIVRMGVWDVSKSTKGREEGPQVVWESDVPVVDLDSSDK